MPVNQEKVVDFYRGANEDGRAAESRARSLEFHYTKKLLREFIGIDANVIELGCGTGYYGMHFADFCARYTGVDLSPDNISLFNEKIKAAQKRNIRAVVGNAACLSGINDNSYDAVLCLGPMYHLPRDERLTAFDVCRRIAKEGAVLAFSYINRLGVYAAACLDAKWRAEYAAAEPDRYILEYGTLESLRGVFYFTSPEEMRHDAESKDLAVMKNCGLDYIFAQNAINSMGEDEFALYMKLADRMAESPSCAGLSDHALMICKK
jgi:ubiquinone/menaquinone biosynthesis C-methylase UbiE